MAASGGWGKVPEIENLGQNPPYLECQYDQIVCGQIAAIILGMK